MKQRIGYIKAFSFLASLSLVMGCILISPAISTPTSEPDSLPSTNTPSPPASDEVQASTSTPDPGPQVGATPALGLFSEDLYAFIQVPQGPLELPYVILYGFLSAVDETVEIRGVVNSNEFICPGTLCALPVATSSSVVFRAYSSTGDFSDEVVASVRVEERDDGYYVFLDSVSQFGVFSDSCLRFWRLADADINQNWAQFVQFPYFLNTNKTLHHLTTRLILYGMVDVSDCQAGGLNPGLDWPTGCGLERARDKMTEWQNQFDEYIWLASKDTGIPPKILKTLIEVESQFWPGNERFYLDEFGLGQVNQLGVDVLLRRNPEVYQQICNTVLNDCSLPYALLPADQQRMIRGALVVSQSAVCPTCQNGIDLDIAKQSVPFIASVLKANCEQVKVIVDKYESDEDVDDPEDPYSDFWKFTMLSYHSGISCFEESVAKVAKIGLPVDWDNVSGQLSCDSGVKYVDGFWGNLLSFDTYRYTPGDLEFVQVNPVFLPTRTPIPTATPNVSNASVEVIVYLDSNQNDSFDEGEGLDGIPVLLNAQDGTELSQTTANGVVVFDLSGLPVGIEATISLANLFRSETFVIPRDGVVTQEFKFDQPVLPTTIP
jgi:hypothetical protein